MKNLVLVFALACLLAACNSKTISKKDLTGSYSAAIGYDTLAAQQQSPEQLQAFNEFMASLKITYKFNEDGTGSSLTQIGERSDTKNLTWSLPAADTIKFNIEGREQVFRISKNEKGFTLDGPEKVKLVLTKQ